MTGASLATHAAIVHRCGSAPASRCSKTHRVRRQPDDLFIPPGGYKPREPREVIAARYELCEDMAQLLTEQAKMKVFELGAGGSDVLGRVRQGLLVPGSVVAEDEAGWVVCRLAELLGWPVPSVRPVD